MEIGESRDYSFSGRLAESAKTRGASESEPAALKVQLGAVAHSVEKWSERCCLSEILRKRYKRTRNQ